MKDSKVIVAINKDEGSKEGRGICRRLGYAEGAE
jgi:hypothetical protein